MNIEQGILNDEVKKSINFYIRYSLFDIQYSNPFFYFLSPISRNLSSKYSPAVASG